MQHQVEGEEGLSGSVPPRATRRDFLKAAGAAAGGLLAAPLVADARGELPIRSILVQEARGRRPTPVAPNAYAPYRGHEVKETLVSILAGGRGAGALVGVGVLWGKLDALAPSLRALIGLDAFRLFRWDGDRVAGPAEEHRELLDRLGAVDVALLDLLGKTLRRPAADLLGKRLREEVPVYDSSLYMEDLLRPAEREGLAYLDGAPPADPAELPARKARWVLARPEGVRTLKIKIGRAKWMASFDEAVERDIAVFRAVRKAVGPEPVLFVDGNDGYAARPLEALRFAEAVRGEGLLAMEEMFPETKVDELRRVKSGLRAKGIATLLADGENRRDGIPEKLLEERVEGGPLLDIDQPDMNQNGFLRLLTIARRCERHGLTLAPHNFGSKMGLHAQAHLGLVAPAFRFAEMDDSSFPAIRAPGISIRLGRATIAGLPGLGIELDETRLEKPLLELES